MGDPAGREVLEDLVRQMRRDPAILDTLVHTARETSAPIAALPECDVRRQVATLLESVADAFAESKGLGAGLEAAGALAVERAMQGVPLGALLDGFQSARTNVLLKLTEHARSRRIAQETLIDALVELDSYTTQLQNHIIHSYRKAELSFARTGYAMRTAALRGLLHGDRGVDAADAGLDEKTRYHCLIADVTDPRLAPRVEAVLAPTGGTAGFVDGYLCCLAPRLPSQDKLTEITVVASAAQPPRELAAAYRICRATLASALLRGLRGLHQVTDLATLTAVDAYPQLGVALADTFLAGLDPAKDFHRLLAQTALAYLDHGGNADATGAALHVHPNTVKHRLRRFAELTAFGAAGGQVESVTDAMRWWWALDAWLRLIAS
jgi:PucR C-terminal helix-turn-helix domain